MLAYVLLRRARHVMPEMFDGPAALASIEACLRQDGVLKRAEIVTR